MSVFKLNHGFLTYYEAIFCSYICLWHTCPYKTLCAIWYHLYNFKNVKNTYEGVLLLVKLQASLLKLTLLHWFFFSCFLNCKNGTKASHISKKKKKTVNVISIFSILRVLIFMVFNTLCKINTIVILLCLCVPICRSICLSI